jgi:hypothetical protein
MMPRKSLVSRIFSAWAFLLPDSSANGYSFHRKEQTLTYRNLIRTHPGVHCGHLYAHPGERSSTTNLEKKVLASAQAKLDYDRVVAAMDGGKIDTTTEMFPDRVPTSQWYVALAAAGAAAGVSFVLFQNIYISAFGVAAVLLAASQDPLDEDDNVYGALVRLLGRATIQSVEASQPRVRALARAVLTGEEEIGELKRHIVELQEENHRLQIWIRRRVYVDENISAFSFDELKDQARCNGIKVGGTKTQLLMRLLEAEIVSVDD